VNSPTVCSGLSATVTATPGTAGTYSYAWTVPVTATAPGDVASFPTTIAGTYSVIITNTVTGCVSTSASGTVTANSLPTVTVNSPTVCSGAAATVTATPGVAGTYSYAWTVPATATSPGNVASFTATVSGSYSVIITNTVTGCISTSASGTVTINPLPTVTVNSPTVCSGAPATVTATPGVAGTYSYAWTVPATATAPGDVASFTATVSGSYSVIITNTVTGCVSTSASGTVTLNPLPTVTVNNPTVCSGAPATVTATPGTAGTYSYAWTVPATATAPGDVASFTATVSGSYSVIITNTVTGCVSTSASGTVTLNPLPTVTVNSPTVCSGTSATVTATPGASGTYSYAWTVPATATNPGNVANFFATIAGTYSVIITNTVSGCVSISASGTVIVNPLPTVTVNSPTVCLGTLATVTATPGTAGTYSYAWTVPAAGTNPGDVASFTTTIAGTYSVIITNSLTGCVSTSASGSVTLNPLPTVTVNNPTVCSGLAATVTATPGTAGSYSYAWTVPATATNPGNVSSFSTTVVGTYSVMITNTLTGCVSASGSGTVTLNPLPTALFTADKLSGCPPVCVNFADVSTVSSGTITSWAWDFGGAGTASTSAASFCFNSPGQYNVTLSVTTSGGCSSTSAPTVITVFQIPTAAFSPSPQPASVLDADVTMNNQSSSDVNYWNWTFGDGDTLAPGPASPTHTYPNDVSGTYTATLIVHNANGCYNTISHDIIIAPEFTFFIPNAFSPNGDNINDTFYGQGIGIAKYEIYIFDRWGNNVFYGDDLSKVWDGKANHGSEMAQEDVYIWKVKLLDVNGKKHNYIGTVTIVK
jgi:gliding motility-associated-like protein